MDIETETEIDKWPEDNYELVLVQTGEDRVASFSLVQRRKGRKDRDVTEDFEVYARRIKQLARGCRMTDEQFRALMELLMCSDPWPISGDYGITAHDTLTALADDEAHARNSDNWIVAYHEMGARQNGNS